MSDMDPSSPTIDISSDAVQSTKHLPRLFVELLSPAINDSSGNSPDKVIPLQKYSLVPLNADQEHYLLDVMRIANPKRWGRGSNDYTGCVRIFNGVDGEWLAKVVAKGDSGTAAAQKKQQRRKRKRGSEVASSGTVLECIELLRPQEAEPNVKNNNDQSKDPPTRLYLGYIKDKQRRRWTFEKATELGIDSIKMLQTEYSNSDRDSYKKKDIRWEEEDKEKHRSHVIEAAEQCERLTVPSVGEDLCSFETLSQEILSISNSSSSSSKSEEMEGQKDPLWLVCRERSESSPPILNVLINLGSEAKIPSSVNILVGPEGGWSQRELEIFSSMEPVQFVSLGPSVLRAETAAVTALASVRMHRETLGER